MLFVIEHDTTYYFSLPLEIDYCVHSMNLIAPFSVGLIAIEMCPTVGKGNHGE